MLLVHAFKEEWSNLGKIKDLFQEDNSWNVWGIEEKRGAFTPQKRWWVVAFRMGEEKVECANIQDGESSMFRTLSQG